MKTIAITLAALASLSLPVTANAAACRDAHGHFIKCATTAAALTPARTTTAAAPAHRTTTTATTTTGAASRVAAATPRKTCRGTNGRFVKC